MTSLPHLERLLTLQTPVKSSDGAGGYGITWVVAAQHWASVRAQTGRTASGETAPVTRQSYDIITRATPDGSQIRPRPGQRFVEGHRIYTIMAVSEHDLKGRYLTCSAIEEASL